MPRTGMGTSVSYLLHIEEQHPGAPEEVTTPIIWKQLLVRSWPREGLFLEETLRNGDTLAPLGIILSSPPCQLNAERSGPSGAIWSCPHHLQFNTMPSAVTEIGCKNLCACVVKLWLGELSTLSSKVTHKNVVLGNFIFFAFCLRWQRSSETNLSIIVTRMDYRIIINFYSDPQTYSCWLHLYVYFYLYCLCP